MKSTFWPLLMVLIVVLVAAVVAALAGVSLIYHAVIAVGLGFVAAGIVLVSRRMNRQ